MSPSRDLTIALGLIGLALVWSFFNYADTPSPDLLASWLAGEFFSEGRLDQIYPADELVYSMAPPSEWWSRMQARGYSDPLFPFVYPPIWAALAAPLTENTGFGTVEVVARLLNPVLLGATVILAARILQTEMPLWLYAAIALAVLNLTAIGIVALEQNQPQILVSFLIVFGIERGRAGRPVWAGAAMALAAAIKLYPALFALAWLLRGRFREVLAFAVVGGGLALLSVALTGWPLHAAFLDQVQVISGTAFSNKFVWSYDPLIARIFFEDALVFAPAIEDPRNGWDVMAKSQIWRWTSLVALLLAVAMAARIRGAYAWPVIAVVVGLFSPLSWGYHYITAVAFVPVIAAHYSPRITTLLLFLFFAPISVPAFQFIPDLAGSYDALPDVGTLAMTGLLLAFWAAARRANR